MAPENPWLDRRVLAWAHQGGAREGPSSTLRAMRRAVAAGAHAIELDVHATADGHVVVCHDPTLDRTTERAGRICDLTLAEVQATDNAHWWVPGEVVAPGRDDADYVLRGRAPADPELCVPTLAQVLDAFPDTFLNFDIKQSAPAVAAYEHLVADALRAAGRVEDVVVASFDDATTARFSEIAPEVATSAGTAYVAEFFFAVRDGRTPPPTRHVALQVPARFEAHEIVTERFVEVAHDHGLAVHVWTVDDPAEMERLVGLGVDGVMTDVPSVLCEVLTRLGVSYRP